MGNDGGSASRSRCHFCGGDHREVECGINLAQDPTAAIQHADTGRRLDRIEALLRGVTGTDFEDRIRHIVREELAMAARSKSIPC